MADLEQYLLLGGTMMNEQNIREDFSPINPYRKVERTAAKMIFLSCEGTATEEGYFLKIADIFSEIKSKIGLISVMADIVKKPDKHRTQEEKKKVGKNRPLQLVERMEQFCEENKEKYDFAHHPEDEFWIIADVDHHWIIADVDDHTEGKESEDWKEFLAQCKSKNYKYAISNPLFEVWLLLHHTDVIEEDYAYAVTKKHKYEKTSHYRKRLREVEAPLKEKKYVKREHYTADKVRDAVLRAKKLHMDELVACENEKQKEEVNKWPHDLGSTVYRLLEEIVELYDKMRRSGTA